MHSIWRIEAPTGLADGCPDGQWRESFWVRPAVSNRSRYERFFAQKVLPPGGCPRCRRVAGFRLNASSSTRPGSRSHDLSLHQPVPVSLVKGECAARTSSTPCWRWTKRSPAMARKKYVLIKINNVSPPTSSPPLHWMPSAASWTTCAALQGPRVIAGPQPRHIGGFANYKYAQSSPNTRRSAWWTQREKKFESSPLWTATSARLL